MKRQWLIEISLALLATIFLGIVIHAPYTVFLGSLMPEVSVPIKAWKEVLMLIVALLLLIEIARRQQWRILWDNWALRLAWAFIGIHLLMLPVFWQGVWPSVAGLMIDLRFVAFFALVYLFLRLEPGYRQLFWRLGAIGAIIVIGFGFLQLFLPHDILKYLGYSRETIAPYLTVDQNYGFIRINSTLRGPNPLGAYAMGVLVFLAAYFTNQRLKNLGKKQWWLFAGSVVMSLSVLYVSHSRSAWLAAVVGLVIVLAVRYRRLVSRMGLAIGLVGLLLTGGALYALKDDPFVSTVILHEDPEEGGKVNSNDGHWRSLVKGSKRAVSEPFGTGIGSTGSASLMGDKPNIIENQYLFVAHEVGWLGLAVFLGLFGSILWRLKQNIEDWRILAVLASGLGLAVIGILLPVWVDDTVAIIWWGLAATALINLAKEGR